MATLVYELRNPLPPIRNGLQVIKLVGANGTVEQVRTMMERQLTQMVRWVDDLLDVSRISRGKIELRTERVEMRSVIAAAVETSRPLIEAAKPQVVDVEDQKPVKSSHRILIVADQRDGANTLAMMLKIMGNDTRKAYNGQAGVDVAGEFRPDVILLDIGLPKLNGHEACRCIGEQSWGKGVIQIAVTGRGQDDDRRGSQEAGFVASSTTEKSDTN